MKNLKDTIRKMINHLNNAEADGGFWLPNIQRPFVWSEAQIEKLFDSIMRQYPISTFLIWRTKNEIKHRKFLDNWKSDLRLTDFYVPSNTKIKRLVLDGQQRLQSLYIGLCGSYEGKELYFDVLSGDLVAPEDIRYRFQFLTADRAKWPFVKFKDIVSKSLTARKLAEEISLFAPEPVSAEQKDKIFDNLDRARQEFSQDENIAYQELDDIDEPDAYRENDVVEIFIRANSGGTKLGKSDLLFSLLISSWEEADGAMESLLEDLNKGDFAFDRDFILKTCLTLLDKGARYDVAKFRDGSTKEEISNKWDEITAAIKSVRDFITSKTYIRSDKAIPSYLALIPIVYFRYHYSQQFTAAVPALQEYLLRSLITQVFGGNPDNLIDKIIRNINEQKNFILTEVFGVIRADNRSLEITPDVILSQSYGARGIHLFFNYWYKDFNYTPVLNDNGPQVDHIFPQSILRSIKDANPETGKRNIMHYRAEQRDQIANCMLLTAQENGFSSKNATPPTDWFARSRFTSDEEHRNYLNMHLIPNDPELWKLENFELFIEERKKLIVNKFGFMLQSN